MKFFRSTIIALAALLSTVFAVSATAQTATQQEIGYVDLVALIGSGLEDGSGVTSAQVEAGTNYLANVNDSQLNNTVFFNASGTSTNISGHATMVGQRMYGSSSMTTGLGKAANPISAFSASDFLFTQTNAATTGGDPEPFNFDVSNHSYILYQSDAMFSDANTINLLQRLDFMVDHNESTMCVGLNNGSLQPLPEFLTFMYNSISVGRTDAAHSSGITSVYGAGRTKPDIVAPDTATSFSSPLVCSAAAILHEAGAGTDATKTETIRALLLSGATKEEFANWDRTTTRPLDEIFGAGELNIFNSYMSLQGGEFNGSTNSPNAGSVGMNGWDYESQIAAGDAMFYRFDVAQGTEVDQLSIVLAWNMELIDQAPSPNVFNPSQNLGNLDLEFYDSSGSLLGSLIDESKSTVDNVEHIYLLNLPAGTYHLRVSSDTSRDFGLAWRSNLALIGDINLDGSIDFLDISPFIELLAASDFLFEADINGDGMVDFFDISPFIALLAG